MLESELKKLTVAVEANTAALLGGVAPVVAAAAKPAAVPAASAAAASAAAEGARTATAPTELPPVSKKQIIQAIINLANTKGRAVAAAILAKFGAAKASELKDASVYPEVLAEINKALGE